MVQFVNNFSFYILFYSIIYNNFKIGFQVWKLQELLCYGLFFPLKEKKVIVFYKIQSSD